MPIANRDRLNGSAGPAPANGQSAFAAQIAAELDALDTALNHPPAGVFPLPPVPRPSIVHRIGARLRREERDRRLRELAIERDGMFPPDPKGGA